MKTAAALTTLWRNLWARLTTRAAQPSSEDDEWPTDEGHPSRQWHSAPSYRTAARRHSFDEPDHDPFEDDEREFNQDDDE